MVPHWQRLYYCKFLWSVDQPPVGISFKYDCIHLGFLGMMDSEDPAKQLDLVVSVGQERTSLFVRPEKQFGATRHSQWGQAIGRIFVVPHRHQEKC